MGKREDAMQRREARAAEILAAADGDRELREAGLIGRFTARLHPRDRTGKWRDSFAAGGIESKYDMPGKRRAAAGPSKHGEDPHTPPDMSRSMTNAPNGTFGNSAPSPYEQRATHEVSNRDSAGRLPSDPNWQGVPGGVGGDEDHPLKIARRAAGRKPGAPATVGSTEQAWRESIKNPPINEHVPGSVEGTTVSRRMSGDMKHNPKKVSIRHASQTMSPTGSIEMEGEVAMRGGSFHAHLTHAPTKSTGHGQGRTPSAAVHSAHDDTLRKAAAHPSATPLVKNAAAERFKGNERVTHQGVDMGTRAELDARTRKHEDEQLGMNVRDWTDLAERSAAQGDEKAAASFRKQANDALQLHSDIRNLEAEIQRAEGRGETQKAGELRRELTHLQLQRMHTDDVKQTRDEAIRTRDPDMEVAARNELNRRDGGASVRQRMADDEHENAKQVAINERAERMRRERAARNRKGGGK